MKKFATSLLVLALCSLISSAAFASNAVRITQVYGGGGGGTGTYVYDYVELLNFSGSPVDISGWALEYGSATGNWASTAINAFNFPAGTVMPPCSYLLIQLGTAGTVGVALPVTPDFTTTNLSMSQSNGKVALFNATNSNLACGSELAGTLVDKVSYGTGNCPEGTATGALSSTTTLVRVNNYQDTDNNSVDFQIVATPGQTIHNAASTGNAFCLATPTQTGSWGRVKTIYR